MTDCKNLSPKLKQAAFRIVQQSLANACQRSKSKRLFAELRLVGDVLQIKIRDWEIAFELDDMPSGPFGFQGIRRHVKLLHGVAAIQIEPGRGTSVTVELPLIPDDAA